MTPKSLSIIAILTVLSVAAAVASLKMSRGYATNMEGGLVFGDLLDKIDAVTKVVVKDNNRETAVARGENGIWRVTASDQYPANLAQVEKSILQLAQLRYLEKKTANKTRYERLHLEELGKKDSQTRRIRLLDINGKALADLFVGKKRNNLPGPVSEGEYVRKPDEGQTWLVRGEIDFETKLTSWLQNSILNIREEDILRAEIHHPGGEVVRVSKNNSDDRNFILHDIPEGKKLRYDSDPNNIANVPENLEMLDARKARRLEFSLDKTLTAKYTSRNGLEAKLSLVTIGKDDWLKVEVTAKPRSPAFGEIDQQSAVQIAKRVAERTKGWAFKIKAFKAERLRRGAAEMLVDKSSGS